MLQKAENLLEIGANNRDSLFVREPKILFPNFALLLGSSSGGGNKQNSRDVETSLRFVDELLRVASGDNAMKRDDIELLSPIRSSAMDASIAENDCLRGISESISEINSGDFEVDTDTLQDAYSASLLLSDAMNSFSQQTAISMVMRNHESVIVNTKDADKNSVANSILNSLDVKDCAKVEKYLQGLSLADASIINIQTAEKNLITTRSMLDTFCEKNIEIVESTNFLRKASPVV
mmetsp:Transcript_13098/g.12694  ORF Transcript_13098/g.12694 Transcript_13098/m.12694 type:complete len:235 (+) Transcript_13098:148-852(+)